MFFWGSKQGDLKLKSVLIEYKNRERKNVLVLSMDIIALAVHVVCLQRNGRVNMCPFPPPSEVPRKQGFISVDLQWLNNPECCMDIWS